MVTPSRSPDDRLSDASSSDAKTEAPRTLEVRGGLDQMKAAADELASLFEQTPLTARDVKYLRQAVLEMVDNAIEWGHKRDFDLIVWVDYRVGHDAVTITVRDQGPGFVHGMAKGQVRLSWPELREQGAATRWGFGIMLAHGLVDEIFYNDQGNQVTLIKRFPGEAKEDMAQINKSRDKKRRKKRGT